jgi:hypothetical protein
LRTPARSSRRRAAAAAVTIIPLRMSDNVSAVHEAPELTARSAKGFPRPSRSTSFIGCVAGARKRAVRDTQPVISCESSAITAAPSTPPGRPTHGGGVEIRRAPAHASARQARSHTSVRAAAQSGR